MALKELEEMNAYFEGKKKPSPKIEPQASSQPPLVPAAPAPEIPASADNNEKLGMVLMAALPTVLGGLLGGSTGALAGAKASETGTKFMWDEKQKSEAKALEEKKLQAAAKKEDRKETMEEERLRLERERVANQKESNQLNREQRASDKSNRRGEKQIDLISNLRKERSSLPTTKATQEVSAAYNKVQSAAASPTAAGDLSMIFNYMKMLDPGSVVREGEFANAQNAAGVPDRVRNAYNQAMKGNRLGPDQRRDFLDQAAGLYKSQLDIQKQVDQQYASLAQKYEIDPNDIILNFEANAPKPQTKTVNGVTYRKVEGGWEEVE